MAFFKHLNLIFNLSSFEIEILEKTGRDSAYMCKDLLYADGREKLLSHVKRIWDHLDHKDPNDIKEKFMFDLGLEIKLERIGEYIVSRELRYFANLDEDGNFKNKAKLRRSYSKRPKQKNEEKLPKKKKQCLDPKPGPSSEKKIDIATGNKPLETNTEQRVIDPLEEELRTNFKTL